VNPGSVAQLCVYVYMYIHIFIYGWYRKMVLDIRRRTDRHGTPKTDRTVRSITS
jgi:hypothetical protein